jgi:GT2 family glycosyltransferase
MPDEQLPADVGRLLAERTDARAERDWERADALRAEMEALGWEPQDGPDGSMARPILPATETASDALDEPSTVAASIQVVAEDHPDDLVRCLRGLSAFPPSVPWELVVVADGPSFDLDATLAAVDLGVQPVRVGGAERLGWGGSRTVGMRQSHGEITILLDTSLEPTGDFVAPLMAAFDDPSVGIAGGWGVTSADGREFTDAPPGEVDAIEGYCLAIRREALRAVGGVDRRFRFYRNADLDLSFAVRDAGWRAIRTEPLSLVRHEHRGWESVPDEERDRLSRRNFYRFLDRWRDRRDLLLNPEDGER